MKERKRNKEKTREFKYSRVQVSLVLSSLDHGTCTCSQYDQKSVIVSRSESLYTHSDT